MISSAADAPPRSVYQLVLVPPPPWSPGIIGLPHILCGHLVDPFDHATGSSHRGLEGHLATGWDKSGRVGTPGAPLRGDPFRFKGIDDRQERRGEQETPERDHKSED